MGHNDPVSRSSIPAGVLAAFLASALLSACAGGGSTSAGPESTAAGTTSDTVPATTTAPTTTAPTTTTTAPPPGPPFGLAPAAGAPSGGGLALLQAVRVGGHEGYDRIVFELLPGPVPGYRIRYVRPPIIADPSGQTVRVAGNAFLSIRLEPASGFDLTGPRGQVYTGPARISGSGAGPASSRRSSSPETSRPS